MTVIFVNGILGDEILAKKDKDELKRRFFDNSEDADVYFINGFNPSHLKGFGDLFKSVTQAYSGGYIDYDLTNILRHLHTDLKTRKVLLVGHSQGTFYTNEAYEYLVKNGVPEPSIKVYNVATPADRVAGGGKYVTSSTDKLINSVVRALIEIGSAQKPLPANVDIPLDEGEVGKPLGGHSFSGVYLKSVPERIIGDIKEDLDGLSAEREAVMDDGCFIAPKVTLTHTLKGVGFLVGDKAAVVAYDATYQVRQDALLVAKAAYHAYRLSKTLFSRMAASFGKNIFTASLPSGLAPVDSGQNEKNDTTDVIPEDTQQESLPSRTASSDDSEQNQMDDMLERIDLLRRQIADVEKRKVKDTTIALIEKEPADEVKESDLDQTDAVEEEQIHQQIERVDASEEAENTNQSSGPFYSKVLISEVQIASLVDGKTDTKQEFVELYNPNGDDVSLTDWYLQRKTKSGAGYSSFAASGLFSGKKIAGHGYFLIAREGSLFAPLADVIVDNPLTEDNSLILKNPNGEVADKLGWGQAQEYETAAVANPSFGHTIGRTFMEAVPPLVGNEVDTDSNVADFEFGLQTPRAQNIKYVEAPPPAPKDAVAPGVAFDVAQHQISLSFAIHFDITDSATELEPSGVAGYTFRWKQEEASWQEDAYTVIEANTATFSGEREFTGEDETNYSFQIKTKDIAGNESDWQPEVPASTRVRIFKKILINEIQTAGATVSDEFIELYNPNAIDMDLAGFSLKKKTASGTESNLVSAGSFTGTIKASDFFLIAPQDTVDGAKNYTGEAEPDLRYSGKTFSLASDNTVLLYNSEQVLMDKVGFGTAKDFETVSAPNPPASKSLERKKLGQDSDDNSRDFKVSDQSSPKGTFPTTTLQDITDYSSSPGSNTPGAPMHDLLLKWQTTSTNLDFYQVQYHLNDGPWQDWLAGTQKTQEYFNGLYSLFNEHVYYFRARSTDKEGNIGSWSKEIKIDLINPVVINEVAYVGTDADPKDQWIELYNVTDQAVDLAGWSLVSGVGNSKTLDIKLAGTIGPRGFYLLERTDDAALSDLPAHQVFTGSIGPADLYLRAPNKRYIDKFIASEAGLGSHRYSLERVSAVAFGKDSKNWRINDGKAINGSDRNGGTIYGTPGRQNSQNQLYTYYNHSFMEDTVLKKEHSPYLFGGVVVAKGVTVTLEPGVVVKFDGQHSKMSIEGTLQAVGTDAQNIIFTASSDDEFGGDSNGDSTDTLPVPGKWLGLYFSPESTGSVLEYVQVRYGGSILSSSPFTWGNAIWVDRTSVSLKNSKIQNNRNRGLRLSNSSSIIDTVIFSGHQSSDWPPPSKESKAIAIEGGNPHITNSHFEDNDYGIVVSRFSDPVTREKMFATPVIERNHFVKNGRPMVFDEFAIPFFLENTAVENTFNGVVIKGDPLGDMILKPGLPYVIEGQLTIKEGVTLTLEPGVVMAFKSGSSMKIEGTLRAVGTPEHPIAFRSYYYDQDWVLPGNWLGLHFTKTSQNSQLEYIDILYANKAIYGEGGNLVIKNSHLKNNLYGIYNEPLAIVDYSENNTFAGNQKADIFPIPVVVTLAQPLVQAIEDIGQLFIESPEDVPPDAPADTSDDTPGETSPEPESTEESPPEVLSE